MILFEDTPLMLSSNLPSVLLGILSVYVNNKRNWDNNDLSCPPQPVSLLPFRVKILERP